MVSIAGVLVLAACQSQPSSSQAGHKIPSPIPHYDPATDHYASERTMMVQEAIIGWGVEDQAVIEVMRRVPRHLFVPQKYLIQAYENHPLPIGYGQTISQPYIVALMTEALELETDDVVLEVGTGSGYQAAVLAEIVQQVYTIEIVGALAERAEEQLAMLGYDNVEVVHADGYYGLEEHAPFDAVIVTAAPDHVPSPLQTQLADGGRLVIPVGPVGGYQELWLIERHSDEFITTNLGGVSFVPLTRDMRDE
jgi:protein-L-isoaspartate(D-aspartate) O-methyltransferase